MDNILIIAPHCDDEVLGCGGIIAKYAKKGANIYVALVTNGHLGAPELFSKEGTEKVRSETLQAHINLGVKETIFLDFPAPRLDSVPSYKISIAINEIIKDKLISVMYVPHRGDIHKDHGISFLAALVAARPINNCTVTQILAYETLSETEWAAPFGDDAFIPTVFEDISEYLEDKLVAFKCFSTQIKEFPHPRSLENIENLAKLRGATVGMERAEAFMLIRNIVR
jgi:LmbE family N-acetylglucosaminyl deacetylase